MKEKEIIGLIVGGFAIFLFLIYGVFSGILSGFIGAFGLGFGFVLGVLFILMIVFTLIGKGGRR